MKDVQVLIKTLGYNTVNVVHQRSHSFFASIHPCILPPIMHPSIHPFLSIHHPSIHASFNHPSIYPSFTHSSSFHFFGSQRVFPKVLHADWSSPQPPGPCKRFTQMQAYQPAICTLEIKLQMVLESSFKQWF